LHLGAFANGETDVVASLRRALVNLGHTVLHLDTRRTKENLAKGLIGYDEGRPGGFGPYFVNLSKLERVLDLFQPQIIVCDAGGLGWRPEDAAELKRRGYLLLGVTLSDPDVFPSVSGFAANFDYHTTNSRHAAAMYEDAGIRNTLYFPFGIDRDYVLSEVPPAPELEADVICLGHAKNRPERNTLMKELARDFSVRVYGTGWELDGAEVVRGERQIQASRAGRVHVNFAGTRANYINVKCGVFETIGCGAVLCTARFPEMETFFEYGTEIIGFAGHHDLAPQLRRLFSESVELEEIRRRAFARLVKSHLYEHRWLEVLERIRGDVARGGGYVGAERAARLRETLREREPERSVVISGFYGGRNTGDELLLKAITEAVQTVQPDVRFVVASVSPKRVTELHGLPAFLRTDLNRADEIAEGASATVLGGGGLWHDLSFDRAGGLAGLFAAPRMSVTGMGVLPLLASIRRRPFHVVGMGAGPLQDEDARQFVRWLGEQAESLSVRDAPSRHLLESIEGWRKEIQRIPDPVFALDLEARVPPAIREIATDWPLLAVNVRPWRPAVDGGLFPRLAMSLGHLAQRHGLGLVGFPMQGGDKVDRQSLEEVFASVETNGPKIILDWTTDWPELYGTLSASQAVLSMRLHGCLLAHRVGTPAVGLSYDPKVAGHFAELGISRLSTPIDASSDSICDTVEDALSLGGQLEPETHTRIRTLEVEAQAALADLARRIATAPRVTSSSRALSAVWCDCLG